MTILASVRAQSLMDKCAKVHDLAGACAWDFCDDSCFSCIMLCWDCWGVLHGYSDIARLLCVCLPPERACMGWFGSML